MKLRYIIALLILIIIALQDDKQAESECEKHHSKDTCFYSTHH